MDLIAAFETSKVLIATLIMIYAYFFMRRAERQLERKPWEYLYLGGMFLFAAQMLVALRYANPAEFGTGTFISAEQFLDFVFLWFLLFSFIFQHHLLVKHRVLLISEKKGSLWTDRLSSWFEARRQRREERLWSKELKPLFVEVEAPSDDAALRTQAEQLVAQVERMLVEYKAHISPDKASQMRERIGQLRALLKREPLPAEDVRSKIAEIAR